MVEQAEQTTEPWVRVKQSCLLHPRPIRVKTQPSIASSRFPRPVQSDFPLQHLSLYSVPCNRIPTRHAT